MALLMELKLHELEFLTIYIYIYIYICIYLNLIAPYSIFYKSSFTLKLYFEKIKLQKKDISLISLRNWIKRSFCMKRAFAHFLRVCINLFKSPYNHQLEFHATFDTLFSHATYFCQKY